MTDHKAVMRQALDALNGDYTEGAWAKRDRAIIALREAIAQPAHAFIASDAIKTVSHPVQAIKNKALDSVEVSGMWDAFCASNEGKRCLDWAGNAQEKGALFVAFRAGLNQAIAQPEQPAGWHICPRHDFDIVDDPAEGCPKCNLEMAQPEQTAPRGTDAQILKEREITTSTIVGAMVYGFQNGEYPPDDAAWLRPFWTMGRRDAEREAAIAQPVEPVANAQWAHKDMSLLLSCLKNTNFDIKLITEMLEFAVNAAKHSAQPPQAITQGDHGSRAR